MQLTITNRRINIKNEISADAFLYLYTDYKACTRERASRKPCGNLMEQFHSIIGSENNNKIKRKTDFFYMIFGYYDVSNLVWGCCKILNTTLFFIEIPILKYYTYDFNPHVVSPCISFLLHPALKGSILFLRYLIYCQRRKFACAI